MSVFSKDQKRGAKLSLPIRSIRLGILYSLACLAAIAQVSAIDQPNPQTVSFSQYRVARLNRVKATRAINMVLAPGPSDCLMQYGFPCYGPQDIRHAYGITANFTGLGQRIVIITSFGSPTIRQDLREFDTIFGLPDPPSFTIDTPLGTVPFDPNNSDQLAWALETTIDVEWAHGLAPDADIVLLTSPVDETQGIQGLPEFRALEEYALDHQLGNIISQSWGTAENTLLTSDGVALMNRFNELYERAAWERVTMLASSGDSGAENVDVADNPYPFATVSFPASSPHVTAVGGTTLNVNANGLYSSESAWNDANGASGGGVSQYFLEPAYQYALPRHIQELLRRHRGLPDVALNADPQTPLLVYLSFFPDPSVNGLHFVGGTSPATAQWAGIAADLNQYIGYDIGFLNPILYLAGLENNQFHLFHDITQGNNTFNNVKGYSAGSGYDLVTGWGTPDFSNVVKIVPRW